MKKKMFENGFEFSTFTLMGMLLVALVSFIIYDYNIKENAGPEIQVVFVDVYHNNVTNRDEVFHTSIHGDTYIRIRYNENGEVTYVKISSASLLADIDNYYLNTGSNEMYFVIDSRNNDRGQLVLKRLATVEEITKNKELVFN